MKILVSGGAGFIGSHLVDRLSAQGHDVMVLDVAQARQRDASEPPDNPPRGRSGAGKRHSRVRYVLHDITTALPALVRRYRPDRIYNLACSSNPTMRECDPVHATMTTVVGAGHLLELARTCMARYLQGSSGSIYGDPAVHPQPENYLGNVNANGPRAPHDEAKRCAEGLCVAYRDQHGVETRIARIFSTYGPRMHADANRLISNLITQALRGDDVTIHGDGTQTRSFCYVEDVVTGLISLMESDVTVPVNIGNPEEQTLLQLAERVLRMTGSRSRLRHVAPRPDDAQRRRPDISLAERELGWRPRVPLLQGLQPTVDFFRRQTPSALNVEPAWMAAISISMTVEEGVIANKGLMPLVAPDAGAAVQT